MTLQKRILAQAAPILIFLVVTAVYFGPLFTGKVLVQSDNVQLSGTNAEIYDFQEKGETVRWSNREFGGMPRLFGSDYNPIQYIQHVIFYSVFPKAIMMMFALFVGMYILLQVFGLSTILSGIGSFAYAFCSFNILSIEAGHDNKVIAMAFMAPVLAGVILAYQGKLFKGGILTFFSAGFQLYYGHIQITYYLLIMVVVYLGFVVWQTVKEKSWTRFIQASGTLALATLLAVGVNFTKLYSTYEYSDYSTRGGSELTNQEGETNKSGLDKEYALAWSSGKMEAFTLLFPYFHGGATGESLSKNSASYKELKAKGVPDNTINSVLQAVPLYWGDQPFTGGPMYIGIIVVFLFITGLFILKTPVKWWALSLAIVGLLLSMGKNLMWFTDIFFYYIPLYDKFRSVTMTMAIVQLAVVLIAFLALKSLLEKDSVQEKVKAVLRSAGIIAGIGLFFLIMKSAFFDFASDKDGQYGFPQWLINAMVEDRKSKFNMDIYRGILFVGLAAGAFWMYLKDKWSSGNLLISLGLLILIDFWMVDKRYLDTDDFKKKSAAATIIQKTPSDERILKDDAYYRVFNITKNPFNDGTTSFYHNSIGGYNAIKFQRYQELIDKYLSNMDQNVLNMLNTKYLIVNGQNNQPQVQPNPGALGNAWLVNEVKEVASADEEIELVGSFNPALQALIDQRFGFGSETYSAVGSVKLESYHPEKMTYSFESNDDQFVVFSEIYYKPGWQAYVDGIKADHYRVDYVLRGIPVASGTHKIEFRFEPASQVIGDKMAIVSSIFVLLWIGGGIYLERKKSTSKPSETGKAS